MCDNVTLTRTDKELTADDYTFSEHLLTIKTAGEYTLSGTASSNNFRVKVGEKVGEKASRIQTTLTIENLTINTYRDEKKEEAKQGYSPLDFSEAGETTLTLVGANHLTARGNNPAVFAPWVNSGDGDDDKDAIPLTIDGDGSLVAKGGRAWPGIGNNGSAKICIKSGDITAEGGGTGSSGIGGSWGFSFDSIVIEGGHIRAIAKSDPKWENDIGNGEGIPDYDTGHGQGRKHTILIKGGVVEAGRVYGQGRREDRTKLTHTGGTLIQNGNRTYMSDATLDEKVTISNGKTMKIGKDATVTIGKNGGLEIEDGATLYVDGTVQGNITGGGEIYYKLNYNLDGGEWVDGYTPKDYYLSGTEFELPTEENLNKAGYKFLGWKDKNTDEVVGKIPTSATGIKNVAAQWTANEYTVTFDANGGTVTPDTMTLTHGDVYGELPTPTRDGYTFAGWFTDPNGGAKVKQGDVVTASHTLYAHWTAKTCTVTFNVNGGTVTPAEQTVTYGSTYGELPTLTREGYTFAGWFTEKEYGTQVTAVTKVTTVGKHTLYARWTKNSYEVKFDANGGAVTPETMTVTYGDVYGELPTPTRKGYTFVGWFTNPNGGTQVKADAEVTTAADRTLHAHWTQNIYTVTIKDDKDGKVIETQQIPEGGLAKKPAKEPVREGYTFIGWQANGAAWDFDQNVVERDTEIIALWEKVVIAPDVAIEGGTSFIVGRATENAMVTIGHNVPGFGVANLAYVDVDGKKLNEKDYDAKTGSIKLNVHAAYLNTLSVGEHTLTAHLKGDGYDGQKVSAKLTVSPVPDASGLPKTGDASAPMVWCALGLACLAGLAAMKRRK